MSNYVHLKGRLAKEPQVKKTANDRMVASIVLAVNREKREGQEKEIADFIPVVAWGKMAEKASTCEKGREISVDGKMQIRNYEKDGQKIYITEVIADYIGM